MTENEFYWQNRIIKQQQVLYNKSVVAHNKQLSKYYQTAIKRTTKDVERLYDDMVADSVDGVVTADQMYRYDRYYKTIANLNTELNKLGQAEIKITNKSLNDMYITCAKMTSENLPNGVYSSFNTTQKADEVLKSVWCADHKNWSDRIWNNTQELQKGVEKSLVDIISRGASKDKLVAEIQKRYGVAFYCSDRLVRTETTYVQNQAAMDSYRNAGVEKYQYLADESERTCDECSELNGQVFLLDEAVVGENFPPLHPNDRCAIIPVLD